MKPYALKSHNISLISKFSCFLSLPSPKIEVAIVIRILKVSWACYDVNQVGLRPGAFLLLLLLQENKITRKR